jgi:hypothetical protein
MQKGKKIAESHEGSLLWQRNFPCTIESILVFCNDGSVIKIEIIFYVIIQSKSSYVLVLT